MEAGTTKPPVRIKQESLNFTCASVRSIVVATFREGKPVPRVTFHHDGAPDVDVVVTEAGTSVMRAAVGNGVRGIVGECGGQAMCATCHVYVHDGYLAALPAMSEDEEEMLECVAAPRDAERSRLGCQLVVGDDLAEIAVDVPPSQV